MYIFLSSIFVKFSGLIVSLVIARTLGPNALGVFYISLTYSLIIRIASEAGITLYTTREVAIRPVDTIELFWYSTILKFILGTFIYILLSIILKYLIIDQTTYKSIMISCLSLYPWIILSNLRSVLIANEKFLIFSLLQSIIGISFLVLSYFLFISKGSSLIDYIIFLAFVPSAILAILYGFRVGLYVPPAMSLRKIKFFITGSFSVSILRFQTTIISTMDIVLLSFLSDKSTTGYYGIAKQVVDLVVILSSSFATSLFPILSRSIIKHNRKNGNLIKKTTFWGSFILMISGFIGVPMIGPILSLIYSSTYQSSIVISQIFIIFLTAFFTQTIYNHILFSIGKTNKLLIVKIIQFIATIILVFALFRLDILFRIAYSIIIGTIISIILSSVYLKNYLRKLEIFTAIRKVLIINFLFSIFFLCSLLLNPNYIYFVFASFILLWFNINDGEVKRVIKIFFRLVFNRYSKIKLFFNPKIFHETLPSRAKELMEKHENENNVLKIFPKGKKLSLAYIILEFPKISETFILEEVSELIKQGHDIDVYTIMPPREKKQHPKAILIKQNIIGNDLPFFSLMYFPAIKYYVRNKFRSLLLILSNIIWDGILDPIRAIKLLIIFPRIIYFSYLIKDKPYDGLHTHFPRVPGVCTRIISKLTEIPYSITAHSIGIFTNNPFAKRVLSEALGVIVPSFYTKAAIEKKYGIEILDKTEIVKCGIDLSTFKDAEKKSLSGNNFRILAVGRLIEAKGFINLIHAIEQLDSEGLDIRTRIVGDGPLMTDLKKAASKLRDNIIYEGSQSQNEVIDAFKWADVFVMPSVPSSNGQIEVIPLVISEALAMGVPVIATSVGGIPELIEDYISGLLVPPNDYIILSEKIKELVHKPELYYSLRQNGLKKVEDHSDIKKNVNQLGNIFAKLF